MVCKYVSMSLHGSVERHLQSKHWQTTWIGTGLTDTMGNTGLSAVMCFSSNTVARHAKSATKLVID